jgi:hypothetical protein
MSEKEGGVAVGVGSGVGVGGGGGVDVDADEGVKGMGCGEQLTTSTKHNTHIQANLFRV